MALKILTMLAGASVGGAETFFVSLTLALARAGLKVQSVLKPNAAREESLARAGLRYETAPFSSVLDFRTPGVLDRTITAFAPDIVLAFAGRAFGGLRGRRGCFGSAAREEEQGSEQCESVADESHGQGECQPRWRGARRSARGGNAA